MLCVDESYWLWLQKTLDLAWIKILEGSKEARMISQPHVL